MAKSKIEWTNESWNPVTGCTKVSAGCKHCYAERMAGRKVGEWAERPFSEVRCHPERLAMPLHWRKPRMTFVNSMSDLFHEAVPFEFIDRVLAVIALCPQHTFQVLTKRPARMVEYFKSRLNSNEIYRAAMWMKICTHRDGIIGESCDLPLPNIWLGVSVENQAAADERIPLLLQCPAAVRFVSCEPLLGPVDLRRWCWVTVETDTNFGTMSSMVKPDNAPDWVIAGGETGPGARPMHPDWARGLRDQCAAAGVPFFFKSWGEWAPAKEEFLTSPSCWIIPNGSYEREGEEVFDLWDEHDSRLMYHVGKKRAGCLLDGRKYNEFPS